MICLSTNMAAAEKEILIKLGNLKHLPEFLHECVNGLSKQMTDFSGNTGSDTPWTDEELKKARLQIQNFFCQCATDEKLTLPSYLPENVRNALINVYQIRQKDIISLLIKKNLVSNGHYLVENIDWKLKWILGSSNLATIREPVCQVDLRCVSAKYDSTTCTKNVNFECNLAKVDELISVLTNVKSELDGVSNKS